MRNVTGFVVCATLLISEVVVVSASVPASVQVQNSAQEKAASLRAQLSGVEQRQAELQTRLQKLDENLKPENIEHSLAGVGSTHPEEEREQQRRQLEIERDGVQKQLDLLVTSHTRLETAIAQADTEAYRQSAAPAAVPVTTTASPTASEASTPTMNPERAHPVRRKKTKRHRRLHHAPSP